MRTLFCKIRYRGLGNLLITGLVHKELSMNRVHVTHKGPRRLAEFASATLSLVCTKCTTYIMMTTIFTSCSTPDLGPHISRRCNSWDRSFVLSSTTSIVINLLLLLDTTNTAITYCLKAILVLRPVLQQKLASSPPSAL